MAETEIRFKRNTDSNSPLQPWWGELLSIQSVHNSAVFTPTGEPLSLTRILRYCIPWVNVKTGQFFIDGLCVNPFIRPRGGLLLKNTLEADRIYHDITINYDPNTLMLDSFDRLTVNTRAIAQNSTPLFTASEQGSVQPWLSAVTGTDHNDFHWLGESNVWHTFGVLEIDGLTTIDNYNSIKYRPTGNWRLTFNNSFYLYNDDDDIYWTKIQLNAASTTLLAGIKLSCPHTLNASIPTIFGNQFYPIGKNNNDQIFTVIPRATSLSSGVVTIFGNNSGIAIGESTILTDDVNFEDDNLHTILDETHAYRAFIFNPKVSKYHSLSITITPETIATEYHIVLDNRNNNNLCQIDDMVFNGTDLQNLEIFLPKTTSMTIPANEWRLISIKVVKHATQDATYVFITN